MDLIKQFEKEAYDGCKKLSKQYGYNPTYFLRMMQEHGAVNATKILLATKEPSEGLFKLWEIGKLEMSIEAMALSSTYRSLFTEEELRNAKRRLDDLDYHFPKEG